jgi:Zn-dependent protease with chaperone function
VSNEIEARQDKMAFDVTLGILAPLLCLIFDPMVFTEYLSFSQIFAYFLIGLEIGTLTLWLVFGVRLLWWAGFIAGILFSGALFAFILGIALLPLSIIGSIVIIGLLGFTPFFTSVVFYDYAKKAFKQAYEKNINQIWLISSLFLGISLAIGMPASIQWHTNQMLSESIETLINGEPQSVKQATQKLKSIFWCRESCFDQIVWAYEEAEDDLACQELAQLYQEITGEDIEYRLLTLVD